MEKVRVHLLVSGRVQGVFYRAFTQEVASRLGLHGWVRNLADGRVEAILEGAKDHIEDGIRTLWKGPPGSFVTDIEESWEPAKGDLSGFHVTR